MLNLTNIYFFKEKFPPKLISRCNMKPNAITRRECKGKIFISFFLTSPSKLISRSNKQTNTFTRREYKGKIYVKNIRTKFM